MRPLYIGSIQKSRASGKELAKNWQRNGPQLMSDRKLILGTRASPLALAQSQQVAQDLCAAHGWPETQISLHEIITKGDKNLDTKLAEIGGKGLFTEELEAGLKDTTLDLAVHSLKDLPTVMSDGLVLGAICPRAPAADMLISTKPGGLDDLPHGAKIGTASLRRQAQLLARRPDFDIHPLRGNIQTRLKKLKSENFDAIILAAAGLQRMGLMPMADEDGLLPDAILQGTHMHALDPQDMLPAAGQGALAVQCRADDNALMALLAPLHCPITAACVAAERAFLNALDGSCRTPIAAHAIIFNDELHLMGRVLAEDGSAFVEEKASIAAPDGLDMEEAQKLGRQMAAKCRTAAPQLMPVG